MKSTADLGVRTHLCGQLRVDDVGSEVVLFGWVRRRRDHGGLIFLDLADYTGFTQVVFHPELGEGFKLAESLRSEFVVKLRGSIRKRPDESYNPSIPTGAVELVASELVLLSKAKTPPFLIQDETDAKEELRLRYRFLDLRRPVMQKLLRLRHKVYQATRSYLDENRFCEVETPILTKPTPEGARDFLVPSRLSPGEFYALPQSPQLFKQVLMCSCVDRYYQIVRCFRDEDFRANRQPEFTQIDIEMSFVDEAQVQTLVEGLMVRIWQDCKGIELKPPFLRMSYEEAMNRFGVDAPDMRFGLELNDLTDIFRESEFQVFQTAVGSGGKIKCIVLPDGAELSRKDIDVLTDVAKHFGAAGLAWVKYDGTELKSSIVKFFSDAQKSELISKLGLEAGDLVLIVADATPLVHATLGALRGHLAKKNSLIEDKLCFLWVENFPLLEYDQTQGRYLAVHHPFTSPIMDDECDFNDPENLKARAYDLVLNGQELAGGSIRIHSTDIQQRVFQMLGIGEEEARAKFGFLLDALSYGAPPHGGIAVGLDRVLMLLGETESIREVIPFPKTARGVDLMVGAPSPADVQQLVELGVQVIKKG